MTSCSTNRFVISKSKIQGYLAIYFMLISNQSNFSEIYMTPYRTVIMAGLLCVFLFTAKKEIKTYCTLFFAFLIMYALLIRLSVGGIGIRIIAQFLVDILVVWLAVSINKQHFWERYVKTVVFLASISLMLWLLSILQINIWDQITTEINSLMSYRVYSDSIRYQEYSFKLHGMFLYSHRTVDMRNAGLLENKKQIILTHNTDLIRLLNVQMKDCFNLYILNNMDGGRNGFLPVKRDEKNILISLSDLVNLFQNKNGKLASIIHDKRLFLMAMIPFLRGYIHIMNDPEDLYGQLSRLMHGFENGSLDIADVYKKTFGYEVEPTEVISVSDILNVPISGLDIIDAEEYPLLADTLIQTLIYYHIRMKVEYELVSIFNIPHPEGQVLLLTDIIQKAFRSAAGATQEQKEKLRNHRVLFTSRKTLLNEFNHFEGNMNIFQPAIDITETALQKEVADIENELIQLRAEYATVH